MRARETTRTILPYRHPHYACQIGESSKTAIVAHYDAQRNQKSRGMSRSESLQVNLDLLASSNAYPRKEILIVLLA